MPMRCFNCRELIIAPVLSMYVAPDKHRHIWHCSGCFAVFEETSGCPGTFAPADRELRHACDPISQGWVPSRHRYGRHDDPRSQAAHRVMHPAT